MRARPAAAASLVSTLTIYGVSETLTQIAGGVATPTPTDSSTISAAICGIGGQRRSIDRLARVLPPNKHPLSSATAIQESTSSCGLPRRSTARATRTGTANCARALRISRRTNRLTLLHHFLEHLELEGRLEADEVHAALAAEVAPVEPVPVLEFVPRLAPREEVVVVAELSVGLSCRERERERAR